MDGGRKAATMTNAAGRDARRIRIAMERWMHSGTSFGVLGAGLLLFAIPAVASEIDAAAAHPSGNVEHCASTYAAEAATTPPQWSNYGPAERRFEVGFVMFGEHRDGQWHAWVPSYWGDWVPLHETIDGEAPYRGPQRGQVLEFFSGNVVDAIVGQDEMGHAIPAFTTLDGVCHAPGRAADLPDLRSHDLIRNREVGNLTFASYWQFDPSGYEGCDTTLTVVEKHDDQGEDLLWRRLILDYSPPTERCPHGHWQSQVRAALDLQDGTFLAALQSKVVRLSFADLSPVGTGATVRIVDADLIEELITKGGDLHENISQALTNHD